MLEKKYLLLTHPRIIFAPAHLKDTLIEFIQETKTGRRNTTQAIYSTTLLVRVEGKEIYSELQQLNLDTDCIKAADFRHD
jgi:hypothetical protein